MGRRAAAALAFLLVPAMALGQPSLRVTAESRLELRASTAEGDLVVAGGLRDDLGTPIPGAPVHLIVRAVGEDRPVTAELRTGADGRFRWVHPELSAPVVVRAAYAGDRYHDPTDAERELVEGVADVTLSAHLPDGGTIDLDRQSHGLDVRARSPAGNEGLFVTVENELRAPLASGRTDALGRLHLELPSAGLGPPGGGRIVVGTEGDATRSSARTEIPITRRRSTTLTLEARPTAISAGEPVELRGALRTGEAPLARRAVGIYSSGAHVDTVLTDANGAFRATHTPEGATEEENATFVARFIPNGSGYSASQSEPIAIAVRAPTDLRDLYRAAPLVLAALLLLIVLRIQRGRRAGRKRGAASISRLAPLPRTRWKRERGLSLRVIDATTGAPIEGASITLTREGGEPASGRTGADGCALFEDWRTYPSRLAAEAKGHVSTRLSLRHPPAETVEIALFDLRAKAAHAYLDLADAIVADPEDLAFLTRRDVAERAPNEARPPTRELAERVDRVYFGGSSPSEEEVEAIVEESERRRRDLAADESVR